MSCVCADEEWTRVCVCVCLSVCEREESFDGPDGASWMLLIPSRISFAHPRDCRQQ